MRSSLISLLFFVFHSTRTDAFRKLHVSLSIQVRGGDEIQSDLSFPSIVAEENKVDGSENNALVEATVHGANKEAFSDESSPGPAVTQSSTLDPTPNRPILSADPTHIRKGITSTLSNIKCHLGDTKKNVGKFKNASLHILKTKAGNLKDQQYSLRENVHLDRASNMWRRLVETSNIFSNESSPGPTLTQSSTLDSTPNRPIISGDTNHIQKGITSTLSNIKHRLGGTKKNVGKIKNASLHILKAKADNLKDQQRSLRENLHFDFALDMRRRLMETSNMALYRLGDLFLQPNDETTIILSVLTICLLGTSIGFRSYLYFVSVGQSVGIGLVSIISIITFNVLSKNKIPILTSIQSFLVLLWSVRLTYFLLYREYVNWPEKHQQLEEVNKRAKTKAKFSVWWTCASFYAMMIMPCIYRLKAAFVGSHRAAWGKTGKLGIAMQCYGLGLESVADHQKGAFKIREGNRDLWCNEGVWKYSAHPNYMGEIIFWVGTYLGSMACFTTLLQWALCSMGLLFSVIVMKSAIQSLDVKQFNKYGLNEDFIEHRQTHSIFGPFRIFPYSEQSIAL